MRRYQQSERWKDMMHFMTLHVIAAQDSGQGKKDLQHEHKILLLLSKPLTTLLLVCPNHPFQQEPHSPWALSTRWQIPRVDVGCPSGVNDGGPFAESAETTAIARRMHSREMTPFPRARGRARPP